MKNKIIILFVLAFLFQVNNVFSQGCDADEPADSTGTPAIKIFGYLQSEYNYTLSNPAENTFTFRRARIGVRGKVLNDFSYYMMLETSPFIGGVGSAYLMDAFVAWEKYNWARIAVGSFKQPFGREVKTACNNLTTIDRAIVSDQLVAPQRDYGIMVLGGNKYNRLGYSVALMNGRGLNVKDNNNKKDIIGRATYQLFDFMSLGASFRYGYPSNDDDTRTTYGADILLDFNNLHIQGEYIQDEGDYNRAAGGGCGSEPMELGEKRAGAYGMIWYDTKWDIQPVFKYEYFDQDLDIKDIGYQERMTLGLNYFFNDKIRLQINYQANIETYINQDNDRFLAQIQVKF
ncbi:MAG: porin [Bacteroidota bacterium]